MGDFNAEHRRLGGRIDNASGRRLSNLMDNLDLISLNQLHCPGIITRPSSLMVLDNGGTTIDLAFSSSAASVAGVQVDQHAFTSQSITGLHSDHLPLLIRFADGAGTSKQQATSLQMAAPLWQCREAKDDDWIAYRTILEQILRPIEPILIERLFGARASQSQSQGYTTDTVEHVWGAVRDSIIKAGDATIGRKSRSGGMVRRTDSFWKQPGVPEAAAAFKAARIRFKHYPNSVEAKQTFIEARTNWRRIKTQAQQRWWAEACESIRRNKTDQAAVWRAFNKTKPKEFVPLINVVSDTSANASLPDSGTCGIETTAKYFAQVCSEHVQQNQLSSGNDMVADTHQRLQQKIGDLASLLSRNSATSPLPECEVISAADVEEVCHWLTNPAKATGPDEVHPKLLSAGGPTLYKLLAAIMTYSLSYGVMPREWKRANVTALYKGKDADKSDAGSYRPVSVTCAVVRVMERILFHRIAPKLDSQLSSSQSGFRKGRSCYDNLLRVTNAIQSARSRGSHLPAVFLDLSKAFDTVWHPGLLHKLWQKGIRGRTWLWIHSFLCARQLRVVQSGYASNWYDITAGVPQGSVLAPLLFLVFIDDLAESLLQEQVEVALLADDVVFWPKQTSRVPWSTRYASMQAALHRCDVWARTWKMRWNLAKSNIVCFARKQTGVRQYRQELRLSDAILQPTDSYTYLGLTLHKSGSWTAHFNKLKQRTRTTANLITRVNQRHTTPTPIIIRELVMAIPRAAMLWALPFWKPSESQFYQLNSILVGPLRNSLCLPVCTNRAAMLTEFGTADIQMTRQQQILQFVARLRQSTVEDNLARDLIDAQEFNSDQPDKLLLPFWNELHQIEIDWNVSTKNPEQSVHFKRLMVARYFDQYRSSLPSTAKPGLRAIKLQPGISRYLYHDSKNCAVLRARLRFDLNGLQLGVVATRVATAKRRRLTNSGADGAEIDEHDALVKQQSRCQLCALDVSDSRRHLLVHCPALDSRRTDCQMDLQGQAWEKRLDRPRQLQRSVQPAAHCDYAQSVELFMLGELNCVKMAIEHRSVVDEIVSMPARQHREAANERARKSRPARPDVQERILKSSCACAYPTLSVKVRLASTALFIQHLFRARFPGTITDVAVSSTAVDGQLQNNSVAQAS